jgi:hypothetical protein
VVIEYWCGVVATIEEAYQMGWLGNLKHPVPTDYNSWVDFVCGHCGRDVTGFIVAKLDHEIWVVCSSCKRGNVFNDYLRERFPEVKFGPEIRGLPNDVSEAYDEARRSMSVNAFIGAELLCRKILMHVAVDKGAEEGESFQSYIDHLQTKGYITPTMKPWVDLIREHGNMATHNLDAVDQNRAEHTLIFTAELLRVVYEMEYLAGQISTPESPATPPQVPPALID